MKKFKLNKRLLAVLVAGGMSTSFAGCSSNDNEEKEVINSDTITSIETMVSSTIEEENLATETIVNSETVITTTNDCKDIVDSEGKKGVFVNGNENDYNFYVESGNVYIYGNDVEPNFVTEITELQTSAPETTKVPETTKTPELSLTRFEELSQSLLDELNRNGIVKLGGVRFTRKDMYSMTYILNIEFISEELKSTLISNGYIADDIETILVDAFQIKDVITTHNLSRLKWNTTVDEMYFGLDYFKNDPTVCYTTRINGETVDIVYQNYNTNSKNGYNTNVTDKLDSLSTDEYFTAREKFYSTLKAKNKVINFYTDNKRTENSVDFGRVTEFNINDFADYSVAINDLEAKSYVRKSLELTVNASLNNEEAYKTLANLYFFEIENQSGTTIAHCGAGADYAISKNIETYLSSLTLNEFKSLRGYTKNKEDYKQALTMTKQLSDYVLDLQNIVRVHESCTKKLTK